MEERGVEVDHSTLNRWVIKYAPLLEQQFRAHKLPVGSSWRLDETYVKVKGSWKYLYRAVDKAGATVDFLFNGEARSQSRVAVPAQSDWSRWRSREDHDRQERRHTAAIRELTTWSMRRTSKSVRTST